MSFLSGWLNGWTTNESEPKKMNSNKVYNTFSDLSPPSSPKSIHSINDAQIPPVFGRKESIGIEIYETWNTSGKYGTELQNIGTCSEGANKCCKICRKLYKEEENSEWACKYHRGKYQASQAFTSVASLKRWTCCSKEVENAEGCVAGRHTEDKRVTGILNTFNMTVSPSSSSEDIEPQEESPKEEIKKEVEIMVPKKKTKRRGELRHEVDKDDTLPKLAVKYNVSVTDIKRANKLFSDQIFAKKFLIIPEEPE